MIKEIKDKGAYLCTWLLVVGGGFLAGGVVGYYKTLGIDLDPKILALSCVPVVTGVTLGGILKDCFQGACDAPWVYPPPHITGGTLDDLMPSRADAIVFGTVIGGIATCMGYIGGMSLAIHQKQKIIN